MKDDFNNLFLRSLFIFNILALGIISFILLKTEPATGYELSIYDQYSSIFWASLLLCYFFNISNIILGSISKSKSWIYSTVIIFILNAMFLSLPLIRGYIFFAATSSDIFAHLSWIQIILKSGHLPEDLFYPMTHVLATNIFLMGLPISLCVTLMCILFSLYYVVSFYILGKKITNSQSGGLIFLVFSIPLLFSYLHYTFMPFFFAITFIPLFIYLFTKRNEDVNRPQFSLLLVIISLAVVFFHPTVALMSYSVPIVFYICNLIQRMYHKNIKKTNVTTLLSITSISFLFWYLNFQRFLDKIQDIIYAILDPDHTTVVESQVNFVGASNAGFLTVLEMFVKVYGDIFIYFITASICSAYVLKKVIFGKECERELIYTAQYIFSIFFGIFLLLGYFVILQPVRAASYGIVFATVLCGIIFHSHLNSSSNIKKRNKVLSLFIILIICSSGILGIFNLYPSPWKNSPGLHMSQMEINGLNWYLHNNNYQIPLLFNSESIHKYEKYYCNQSDEKYSRTYLYNIPSHFGYDHEINFKKVLIMNNGINKGYLLTSEKMRQLSVSSLFKNNESTFPIYLNTDFDKLNNDPEVNKIYVNSELEIWKI